MKNTAPDFLPTLPPRADAQSTHNAAYHPLPSKIQNGARQGLSKLWRTLNVGGILRHVEPSTVHSTTLLKSWSIYRVTHNDGSTSSHLIGMVDGEARVSSGVHTLNLLTGQVVTERGRVYTLAKDFGYNMHTEYFFEAWLKRNRCTSVSNQTRDFLEMQRVAKAGLNKLGRLCEARTSMWLPTMA